MPEAKTRTADPTVSARLMIATYAVGAVGIAIGMATVLSDPPRLGLACLLAVGLTGVLSFVRHAVFHRSDAARMGWDYGQRNNFQIEVGLANLAWGGVAVLAVVLDWGIAALAALFLVFGLYLAGVAVMQLASTPDDGRRALGPLIGLSSFAVMLLVVGALGMSAA